MAKTLKLNDYADYLDHTDLAKVYRAIHRVCTRWEDLGLELGILYNDIKRIEQEYRGNLEKCLKELLSIWLKRADPKPTWKTLIKALNTVGFGQLAEELEYKQVLATCS